MPSPLAAILDVKKKEVASAEKKTAASVGQRGAPLPIRDFKEALSTPDETALIAEIKFASPSAGVIREREDPRTIGGWYAAAGARAISLVTDRAFLRRKPGDLLPLKKAVPIPVLRKDFILDEIQVEESFAARRRRPAAYRPLPIRKKNAAAARSFPKNGEWRP